MPRVGGNSFNMVVSLTSVAFLLQNKGPDAPYALEGADPLLGAASPSLGEEDSGGAWWSQLTKIPTADWLHLNPRQTPDSNAAETSVEGDAVKSNSSGPKEEPTSVNGAEVPAVADVDREGFSTFSFESNGAALSVSEGEVVTPPSEYEVEAQPPLDVPQNLALSVEAGIAETVASAVGLESQARGELEDLLAFLPADSQSTDAGTRNTESALALSTEVPAGVIEPPPSLQVSEVTPEEQSNLEVDSPHTGLAEAETQPPVEGAPVVDSPVSADFIDQVSVDPLNIPAAAATLAPAQLPPAPLETATDGVLGEAPEKQAHIAVVEATPSESSEVMRKQRAAVEEARARLETIKAWRNSRAAMPPLTGELSFKSCGREAGAYLIRRAWPQADREFRAA